MMKNFIWRKYVSVGLGLSFFMIIISGIVLYVAPPGRIARWTGWGIIGLDRAQWETQHTIFSYLFIVFGLVHLFTFNWRSFISYLGKGVARFRKSRTEALLAFITVFAIFFLTLFRVPPVITVMDMGNRISDIWEKRNGKPPVPGIENMSIDEISAKVLHCNTHDILDLLKDKGYDVSGAHQTLSDIGLENNLSPVKIYEVISSVPLPLPSE